LDMSQIDSCADRQDNPPNPAEVILVVF